MPVTLTCPLHDATNSRWEATILPEHGGHCVRFGAIGEDQYTPVFENVPLEKILHKPTSYGCPILFPYAGRLGGSAFIWQKQRFHSFPDRHGLVRHQCWQIINQSSETLSCATSLGPESNPSFPFICQITVLYTLSALGLSIELTVINRGPTFPYSLGLHPYFHREDNTSLQIPTNRRMLLASNSLLPSGLMEDVLALYDFQEGQVLDPTCRYDDILTRDDVLTDTSQTTCLIKYLGSGRQTILSFRHTQFPVICLYTPPDRAAVCIEPYTSLPNALNWSDKPPWYRCQLETGASAKFRVNIQPTI